MSRLVCKSENYEMDLTLDVNVELLPVEKEFKFSVELATTLNLDGTPDSGAYEQGQEKSADNRLSGCDYAMHGKVFKYDQLSANKMCVSQPISPSSVFCSCAAARRGPSPSVSVKRRTDPDRGCVLCCAALCTCRSVAC